MPSCACIESADAVCVKCARVHQHTQVFSTLRRCTEYATAQLIDPPERAYPAA